MRLFWNKKATGDLAVGDMDTDSVEESTHGTRQKPRDQKNIFEIDGKRQFAEVWGSSFVSSQRNFLLAVLGIIVAGIALTFAVYAVNNQVVKVMLVEYNDKTGELRKPIELTKIAPNQAVIQSTLAKFTEKCFTIDPKLSQVYLKECAAMATGRAVEQLKQFRVQTDVTAKLAKGTVLQFAKTNNTDVNTPGIAFQTITTTEYSLAGEVIKESKYRVRLDYVFVPPKTQTEVYDNPLGIYVSLFSPQLER